MIMKTKQDVCGFISLQSNRVCRPLGRMGGGLFCFTLKNGLVRLSRDRVAMKT